MENILDYNGYDWYWNKLDGTVYSSAYDAEFPADNREYLSWLERGGVPTPYPKDARGQESRLELMKILAPYGLGSPDDYQERDDGLYKIHFSKKDFLLWCGLENIIKLNAAIAAGNMTAKTVHDLLFAADYIDVTDPASVQMVQLLTTEAAGNVLTADDAARILQGEKYEGAA